MFPESKYLLYNSFTFHKFNDIFTVSIIRFRQVFFSLYGTYIYKHKSSILERFREKGMTRYVDHIIRPPPRSDCFSRLYPLN